MQVIAAELTEDAIDLGKFKPSSDTFAVIF
jgi:hypothetical protein